MTDFIAIVLGACLVNNLVLHHLLAAAPVAALSRRVDAAAGLGIAVGGVIVISTPLCWLLDRQALQPLGVGYLRTLLFLVLIAVATTLGRALLARLRPAWHNRLAVYFPFALLNSGILGAALLAADAWHDFGSALAFAIGAGAGFMLVCVLFAGLQDRAQAADVPEAFRGVPVQLLVFAFLSMAFMGLSGPGH